MRYHSSLAHRLTLVFYIGMITGVYVAGAILRFMGAA